MTERDDGGAAFPLTQEQFQKYMASLSANGDILRKRVTCADGFNISIQASSGHYCHPRVTGEPVYYEWELGYPTAVPVTPEILGYAEDPESPLRTVYKYVPTAIVLAEINAHGGIADALLSARKEPT